MTAPKANPKKSVPPSRRAALAKASAMKEALIAAQGATPLEVMLRTMRDLVVDADKAKTQVRRRALLRQAADVAKDAAPYVHPKLASVTHNGGDKPIQFTEVRRTIVRPGGA